MLQFLMNKEDAIEGRRAAEKSENMINHVYPDHQGSKLAQAF